MTIREYKYLKCPVCGKSEAWCDIFETSKFRVYHCISGCFVKQGVTPIVKYNDNNVNEEFIQCELNGTWKLLKNYIDGKLE